MSGSVVALWGRGGGGARILLLSRASKWEDSEWRPGSILMDGESALMYMASFIPLLTQSCSYERIETSSFRKWWFSSRACCNMADLYLPRALEAVEVCS